MSSFRSLGAELVAVSPQSVEKSVETRRERKLDFDILVDEGYQLADAMGLSHGLPDDLKDVYLEFGLDLGKSNHDGAWKLPMPARYVVDTEGIIQYAQVHADYTRRPEPEHTLEALKKLVEG